MTGQETDFKEKIAIFLMSPRSICLGAINTAPGLQGGIACSKRTNLHILTSDLRLFVYFGFLVHFFAWLYRVVKEWK